MMLWQVKRGLVVRHWQAHEGAVRGCAASADGRLLASAGADGAVLVWDGASAARLHTLPGHREWVNDCAFAPGGELLASVSNDRTLRLWDLRTRSRRVALLAHEHWINRCAFSPDGRDVVTVCADGGVKRWSLDLDEALWEAWLSDSQPLSAAAAAKAMRPLDFKGHEASVNDCAFSPDGATLVTASSDHLVKQWDRHSGRLLRNLTGHLDAVQGCDVSPGGQRIASVSAEGGVKVWDAVDGRCLMSLQVDGSLTACAWMDAGATLAVVGLMGAYFFSCA
jgi:WD40 repeat protein